MGGSHYPAPDDQTTDRVIKLHLKGLPTLCKTCASSIPPILPHTNPKQAGLVQAQIPNRPFLLTRPTTTLFGSFRATRTRNTRISG